MKALKIYLISFCSVLLLGAFTYVLLDHYQVTKDFSIEFKSKDPSGSFKIMEGQIDFDEKDLARHPQRSDARLIWQPGGTKKHHLYDWGRYGTGLFSCISLLHG